MICYVQVCIVACVFCIDHPLPMPVCEFMMTLVTNESGRCVVRFSCILLVYMLHLCLQQFLWLVFFVLTTLYPYLCVYTHDG